MHDFFCITVSPLQENCFVLYCNETKEAALIDAGDEPKQILAAVRAQGLVPKLLLATHAHVDHISAVAAIQAELELPFLVHERELPILGMLTASQSFYGFGDQKTPKISGYLKAGEEVALGKLKIQVIETPGHTPGGVCLKVGNDLFTGDTLFAYSIGRTDLPGGNTSQLMESIKTQLLVLDSQTQVHPGHGPSSSIGAEIKRNPFLQGLA